MVGPGARLVEVGATYGQQLTAVAAVMKGEDVDLDALDSETRAWVEQGLEKNKEWAEESGSTFGPLIPNTLATGDDRGLTPQGLAYDPRTGTYVMSYYPDDDHTGPSTLALVDAVTGQEIADVDLGGVDRPRRHARRRPSHAGGVSVQGDDVIVVDKGKVYTYSMSDIRDQQGGGTVRPTASRPVGGGGSYSAVHDGSSTSATTRPTSSTSTRRTPSGSWQPVRDAHGRAGGPRARPTRSQGLVVRDGEFVFSTSPNRFDDGIAGGPGPRDRRAERALLPAQHGRGRGRGRRQPGHDLRVERAASTPTTSSDWRLGPRRPGRRRPVAQPLPDPHPARGARPRRGLRGPARAPCARRPTPSTGRADSSRRHRRPWRGVRVHGVRFGEVPGAGAFARCAPRRCSVPPPTACARGRRPWRSRPTTSWTPPATTSAPTESSAARSAASSPERPGSSALAVAVPAGARTRLRRCRRTTIAA